MVLKSKFIEVPVVTASGESGAESIASLERELDDFSEEQRKLCPNPNECMFIARLAVSESGITFIEAGCKRTHATLNDEAPVEPCLNRTISDSVICRAIEVIAVGQPKKVA